MFLVKRLENEWLSVCVCLGTIQGVPRLRPIVDRIDSAMNPGMNESMIIVATKTLSFLFLQEVKSATRAPKEKCELNEAAIITAG